MTFGVPAFDITIQN